MNQRFTMFRRGRVSCCQDWETADPEGRRTRDGAEVLTWARPWEVTTPMSSNVRVRRSESCRSTIDRIYATHHPDRAQNPLEK
jgi:hypothetical protein